MIMVTNNDATQLILSRKNNNVRQEKPRHSKYLNEFRTQQCLFFLEQQCQFHRPYTCFDWHFPNQKRRRPFKRPDGTFNYNPDVYCDKYDETSGSCVDGDDCPYAHRNAGDTERRYHPRYFKTGNCIYETTENGACVKNGLHCAFAHGPDDTRLPVYDIREVQDASAKFTVNLPASLEKERVLSEDPKWNEMFHVLACYKTELCKKPPRMCRQGYSCPFYHNGKDKRRAPDKWCYRSAPCPTVRPADEWLDSGLCEAGDNCTYCHTRTEQQFHPEIYKSTKCNDVINSGYCPRGPFCAFAHCDSEISTGRDFLAKLQQDQLTSTGGRMSETSPRGAQLPSGFVVPNLMSQLTTLSGPTAPGNNRGRRMGRCGSPHQNMGLWQSTGPGTDRTHPFMPPSVAKNTTTSVAMNSVVNSSTNNNNNSTLPADTILSLTQTPAGHLPFYQHRPMPNLFQTVITNSMALNAAARDKGRHRSGSSVSSSDGGLFAFAQPDLTSPPAGTRPLISVTNPCTTYPGRGTLVPAAQTLGVGLRTAAAHSGGKTQQTQQTRKKGNNSVPQQQQPQSSGSSFLSDRSGSLGASSVGPDTSSAPPFRNFMVVDPMLSNPPNVRPVGPQPAQPAAPVPLLQNTLWAPESIQSDRLIGSAWPWHTPIDSGHNSETSITDPSDTAGPGLYDLPLTTGGSSGPGTSSATFGPGTLGSDSVNHRDSGLVSDFALSALGERLADSCVTGRPSGSHHPGTSFRDQFSNCDDPDVQISSEGLQELIGQSESFLQQLHSTPIRARSGTIVNHMQRFCPSFISDSADSGSQNNTSGAQPASVSEGQLPEFHSPLDDILLQSQSYLEKQSVLNSLTLNTDISPVFDASLSNASDPMSIPGRGQHDCSGLQHMAPGADRFRAHPSASRSVQFGMGQDAPMLSGVHPAPSSGGSVQQNTWPITHAMTQASTNSSGFTSSVPTSAQISHSFSPIVGTPANARFTGSHSVTQAPIQQSDPFSNATVPASHAPQSLGLNFDGDSANKAAVLFHKSPVNHYDTCELPRNSSLVKIETSSDSSSCSPHLRIDNHDSGPGRVSGSRNTLLNGSYANLPQSPILMPSPFNNPGYELERLSLQRELDEVRQQLGSKEDELETIKRQRDFVAEHLRDSLDVIQKLFHSFQVSSTDLSRPLYVDTDHAATGSDPSTGYSATGFTASEASPMPEEDDPIGTEQHPRPSLERTIEQSVLAPGHVAPNGTANEVLLDRQQLQQQQEALTALFANPFVSALLNSTNTALEGIAGREAGANSASLWSRGNVMSSGQESYPPGPAAYFNCDDTGHTATVSGTAVVEPASSDCIDPTDKSSLQSPAVD